MSKEILREIDSKAYWIPLYPGVLDYDGSIRAKTITNGGLLPKKEKPTILTKEHFLRKALRRLLGGLTL